jgi:hypothetical protein
MEVLRPTSSANSRRSRRDRLVVASSIRAPIRHAAAAAVSSNRASSSNGRRTTDNSRESKHVSAPGAPSHCGCNWRAARASCGSTRATRHSHPTACRARCTAYCVRSSRSTASRHRTAKGSQLLFNIPKRLPPAPAATTTGVTRTTGVRTTPQTANSRAWLPQRRSAGKERRRFGRKVSQTATAWKLTTNSAQYARAPQSHPRHASYRKIRTNYNRKG